MLEWARIAEFRAEGSPVETVRRSLPKRAAGPKHHDALHWPEVGRTLQKIDATHWAPSTKRAIRFTADGIAADRGTASGVETGIAASGHGFRPSFKDWARQHDVDETLLEFALAHVEGSATDRHRIPGVPRLERPAVPARHRRHRRPAALNSASDSRPDFNRTRRNSTRAANNTQNENC